jgi:Asp-tRNA(Asn)/Glu-tRNA(Gln) amidotransferase A subunit family amidase
MLKDNTNTYDMATTAGSASLAGFVPDDDAFITSRLREAGALILAKTNLHEFAIWGETVSSILGQSVNPMIPPARRAARPAVRARRSPATSGSWHRHGYH